SRPLTSSTWLHRGVLSGRCSGGMGTRGPSANVVRVSRRQQPSTDSQATQQFWEREQSQVHRRKQTMSSILVGIAALIGSIGLFVLCSGVGIYFLSNSKSRWAGRL